MSSKSSTSVPGYIWLLSGLAIGLFIALLVYLGKQPAEKTSFTQAVSKELDKHKSQNTGDKKTGTSDTVKKEDKSSREPRFDFYTILPESEVFVPEPATRKPDNAAATSQTAETATTGGKQYLLQAGSFRNHADADNLKANLALLGVTSSIQSVNINNESWHRVRIGPFNNDKKLRDTLATLKNNNIHAMTMELK
ncbi:MAG: SPOR domain-containing protein [Gammaproteobacteria bacterium]|nr:SPOR domain-containing protein [Gammaproteobacteria bacterium]